MRRPRTNTFSPARDTGSFRRSDWSPAVARFGIIIPLNCRWRRLFPAKKFGGKKPATVVAWPAGQNAFEMEPRQSGR